MSTQNFVSHRLLSVKSFRTSVCDFIGYIQTLIYMPVLICMVLLFSSNSYSFSTHIEQYIRSAQGFYQAVLHVEDDTNKAVLKFSGNLPASLDGFAQYTIHSFNLKIGDKEYPVTEYNNYNQLVSLIELENLNYPINNFPQSELVFSYSLSASQASLESRKCSSAHPGSGFFWWDLLVNSDYRACVMKAWNVFWKSRYYSIDTTNSLETVISNKIHKMDDDASKRFGDLKRFANPHYFRHAHQEAMKSIFPSDANSETQIQLEYELRQSISVFNAVSYDYFEKESTSLLDAYYRQKLVSNLLNTFNDTHDDDQAKLIFKAIKPFESEKCEDELPNNLPMTLDDPQLVVYAKKYASEICQYNTISFNSRAANPPTNPHVFSDTAKDKDNSTFLPYVFCDNYRCVIQVSEILSYKLSLSDALNTGFFKIAIDDIKSYLLLDRKAPKELYLCSSYCTVRDGDIDGLQIVLDKLRHDSENDHGGRLAWIIIMYKK